MSCGFFCFRQICYLFNISNKYSPDKKNHYTSTVGFGVSFVKLGNSGFNNRSLSKYFEKSFKLHCNYYIFCNIHRSERNKKYFA